MPTFVKYCERDIRHRTRNLEVETRSASKPQLYRSPSSSYDPFDGYTAKDFANDFCVDDDNDERALVAYLPSHKPHTQRRPAPRRPHTSVDERIIKRTVARIMRHCRVRDEVPYMNSPRQEVLHRIRTEVWTARARAMDPSSADSSLPNDADNDNGVRITEDGCIIQQGFDISPLKSTHEINVHIRCDSGCETWCMKPNHVSAYTPSPEELIRSAVRNTKGARIPIYFRKREITTQRSPSSLTALLSGTALNNNSANGPQRLQKNQYQTFVSQQRSRMPVPARPVVFFTGYSGSSNAIASDSDDGDDELSEDDKDSVDTATSSSFEDGAGGDGIDGNIAAVVPETNHAEHVKRNKPQPQPSAQSSPPTSNSPAAKCPGIEQHHSAHAGTPLLQQPSQCLKPAQRQPYVGTPRPRQPQLRPERPQLRDLRSQFVRSQQATKVAEAQQQRSTGPAPHAQPPLHSQPPRQAPDARFPPPPDPSIGKGNFVSVLLEKIEWKKGARPLNFQWNHVAPMHGFSVCRPFFVLD